MRKRERNRKVRKRIENNWEKKKYKNKKEWYRERESERERQSERERDREGVNEWKGKCEREIYI